MTSWRRARPVWENQPPVIVAASVELRPSCAACSTAAAGTPIHDRLSLTPALPSRAWGRRGRCVLRAPSRPIVLDGYAPGSGPRVDQGERDILTGIGEQPCALAD